MTDRQKDLLERFGQFLTGGALAGLVAAGCGIALRRDFSKVTPQAVVFDDLCGLQDYHDALVENKAPPISVVSSTELTKENGDRPAGGKTTFAFDSEFQLSHLRRILGDNWKRLPDEVMKANNLHLEVRWAERVGVKRVVTDEDAELSIDRKVWALPYSQCLSEFLFGATLYATRRDLLGLPPVKTQPQSVVAAGTDGDTAPLMATPATPAVTAAKATDTTLAPAAPATTPAPVPTPVAEVAPALTVAPAPTVAPATDAAAPPTAAAKP